MKILLTGANKGLGLNLCKALLNDGHKVFAISKNTNNLSKLKKSNLRYYKVDLRNFHQIDSALTSISDEINKIDILINNAALYLKSSFLNTKFDEINKIIDTNIKGTIFITKLTLQKLLPGPGRIIMINSVAGINGIKNESIYCASKFALKGFSESLQIELKKKKIFISNLFPGGIKTSLWNKKNIYSGNVNKLTKPKDIYKIIKFIIELPKYQILKNITTYPECENH
jgi:NADP-dependent 3-hydroxy acid dehydrogenase YdfG